MIGWLDCSAGASGDLLLGALVDAGVPLTVLQEAVDAVGVEPVRLRSQQVQRAGLGALRVHVEVSERAASRTWADVRQLLAAAELAAPVRALALDVFERLATAEGAVHRVDPDQVHFHEVGALDAVADVVGVVAGVHALGLSALTASPVAIGSGSTRGAHGPLPLPAPAVLALLEGAPVHGGPVAHESTTPTGAALLATLVSRWEPLPPMVLRRTGTGAGGRDPAGVANVVRLVLGDPVPASEHDVVVLETNVDDLDPRLWPDVLEQVLAAGALDVWLTPVLMKKGRPAHVLSALVPVTRLPLVRATVFAHTSTLGVRESAVSRTVLDRRVDRVEVSGVAVRVKRGLLDGEVTTSQPEWADVAAAAEALGLTAKDVLARAIAAGHAAGPTSAGGRARGEQD